MGFLILKIIIGVSEPGRSGRDAVFVFSLFLPSVRAGCVNLGPRDAGGGTDGSGGSPLVRSSQISSRLGADLHGIAMATTTELSYEGNV